MIIVISEASKALLAAHSPTGRLDPGSSMQQGDGRWRVEVDEEVHAALEQIDADPDVAIRVLCTTGVGRA